MAWSFEIYISFTFTHIQILYNVSICYSRLDVVKRHWHLHFSLRLSFKLSKLKVKLNKMYIWNLGMKSRTECVETRTEETCYVSLEKQTCQN